MTTRIEWVRNADNKSQGCTVNVKTGCLNGCRYCYARKLANGRLKYKYLQNLEIALPHENPKVAFDDPFYPRFWPERLEQVRRMKKPTGIFLDDMSDWMADYWPEKWTEQELQVMRDCPQHRFYTLTRQPQNLIKWSPFPENCWVGITVTDMLALHTAEYYLPKFLADLKFISFEPLLGPIHKSKLHTAYTSMIDWLIIGQQTPVSQKTQPKIEWIQEIVDAADQAGVPVFLKDNLKPLIFKDWISGQCALDMGLLTWEGELRQQLPKGGE